MEDEKKKVSLFSKMMKQKKAEAESTSGFPKAVNIGDYKQLVDADSTEVERVLGSILDKRKFFGVTEDEYKKIDEESSNMLQALTEQEILDKQNEILASLSPELIQFFKKSQGTRSEQTKIQEKNNDNPIEEEEESLPYEGELKNFCERLVFDEYGLGHDFKEEKFESKEEQHENRLERIIELQQHTLLDMILIISARNASAQIFILQKLCKIFQKKDNAEDGMTIETLLNKKKLTKREFFDCLEIHHKLSERVLGLLSFTANITLIKSITEFFNSFVVFFFRGEYELHRHKIFMNRKKEKLTEILKTSKGLNSLNNSLESSQVVRIYKQYLTRITEIEFGSEEFLLFAGTIPKTIETLVLFILLDDKKSFLEDFKQTGLLNVLERLIYEVVFKPFKGKSSEYENYCKEIYITMVQVVQAYYPEILGDSLVMNILISSEFDQILSKLSPVVISIMKKHDFEHKIYPILMEQVTISLTREDFSNFPRLILYLIILDKNNETKKAPLIIQLKKAILNYLLKIGDSVFNEENVYIILEFVLGVSSNKDIFNSKTKVILERVSKALEKILKALNTDVKEKAFDDFFQVAQGCSLTAFLIESLKNIVPGEVVVICRIFNKLMKTHHISNYAQLPQVKLYIPIVKNLLNFLISFKFTKRKYESFKKRKISDKFRETVKFYMDPVIKQIFLHVFYLVGSPTSFEHSDVSSDLNLLIKDVLILLELCKFHQEKWLIIFSLWNNKEKLKLVGKDYEALERLQIFVSKNMIDIKVFTVSRTSNIKLKKEFPLEFYANTALFSINWLFNDFGFEVQSKSRFTLNQLNYYFINICKLYKCGQEVLFGLDDSVMVKTFSNIIRNLRDSKLAEFNLKNKAFFEELCNNYMFFSYGQETFTKLIFFFFSNSFDDQTRSYVWEMVIDKFPILFFEACKQIFGNEDDYLRQLKPKFDDTREYFNSVYEVIEGRINKEEIGINKFWNILLKHKNL